MGLGGWGTVSRKPRMRRITHLPRPPRRLLRISADARPGRAVLEHGGALQ